MAEHAVLLRGKDELSDSLSKAGKSARTCAQEIKNLESTLDRLNAKKVELKTDSEAAKAQMSALRKELKNTENGSPQQASVLSQMSETITRIEQNKNSLSSVNKEISNLKSNLTDAQSSFEAAKKTISSVADVELRFDKATQELTQLKKTFADAADGSEEYKKALSDLESIDLEFGDAEEELRSILNLLKNGADGVHEFSDSISRIDSKLAGASQLKEEFAGVNQQIQSTTQSSKDMDSAISKMENRASGGSSSGMVDGTPFMGSGGVLKGLVSSGVTKMMGDFATRVLTSNIASMDGKNAGDWASTMLSDVTSGAVMGAAVGSVIPGIGTAIGAGVGAIAGSFMGIVDAGLKEEERKNEIFHGIVQDQLTSGQQLVPNTMASGQDLSMFRDTSLIQLTNQLGDINAALDLQTRISKVASDTSFGEQDLTALTNVLLSGKFNPDYILDNAQIIGDATAGVGGTTQDMMSIGIALQRMNNSNKSNAEELNMLSDRGLSIYDWVAEAWGVSFQEARDKLKDPQENLGQEVVQIALDKMQEKYGGTNERLAETYKGRLEKNEELKTSQDAAMFDGYKEKRSEGLAYENEWLEVGAGQGIQDAYSIIGQTKAEQENTQEAVRLGVMEGVSTGDMTALSEAMGGTIDESNLAILEGLSERWQTAMEEGDGAELESILGIMESLSDNLYQDTEEGTAAYEAQLQMAEGIQQSVAANENVVARIDTMNNLLSVGMEGVKSSITTGTDGTTTAVKGGAKTIAAAISALDLNVNVNVMGHAGVSAEGMGGKPKKKAAWGLNRVPYDGYDVTLHEGERVLTAEQTRQMDNSSTDSQVVIQGNNFTVREEADIYKIAQELAREIALAHQVVI